MKGLEGKRNWDFTEICQITSQIVQETEPSKIIPHFLGFVQQSDLINCSWCNQYWIDSNLSTFYPNLPTPPSSISKKKKAFATSAPFDHKSLTKKGAKWLKGTDFQSAVFVPINVNDQQFAQITFFSSNTADFSPEFLAILSHMADITALAVSKTWLARERLAIQEFSQNMAHAITPDDAIQTTLALLSKTINLSHTAVLIPTKESTVHTFTENEPARFTPTNRSHTWKLPTGPLLAAKDSQELSEYLPSDYEGANLLTKFEQAFLVPLFSQKTIKGTIVLAHSTFGREFSSEDIEFATLVTDLLNTTLENLSLFDELIRRAQELISLNQISEKISGTLNNQELAQIVYGEISHLTSCQLFLLALVETGNRYIQPLLLIDGDRQVPLDPIPLKENSGFFWAIHELETVLVESHDPLMESIWEMLEVNTTMDSEPANCIFSPMAHGTIGYGLMIIFAEEGKPFTPDDIQIVRAVSHQAALGLANSALLQAEQNHVSELRALSNVTRAMATGITSQERITGMIRTLHTSLNRGNISVLMVDSGGTLSVVGCQGRPPGMPKQGEFYQNIIGRALLDQTTQFHPDLRMVPTHEKAGSDHVKSQISVPILISGEVAGVLNADHIEPNSFTDNDLRLLQSVSLSLGSMLENGRLFREIQDANKRLKALDQLKTKFLANMSHELRTPLNSIIGFSRIMMKGMDGPVSKEQYIDLESIYNSGQHLLSLINDILDLAKLEAGKMELVFDDIDLLDLANSVVATARGLVYDLNVELIVDIDPKARFIEADNIRLRQVLLNLLSNAAKFTRDGSIHLTSRPGDSPDTVIISVQDTGSGIAPETLPRIFNIFEQGKSSIYPESAGTGLGLSIVRELINLHGGRVLVESELDVGSTFHVVIPRAQPEIEQVPEPEELEKANLTLEAETANPYQSDPKMPVTMNLVQGDSLPPAVLLVDDDAVITKLYHRIFENYPLELICVSNGVDALSMIENHQYEIILIILDLHMPEMDGWETVKRLGQKESTRHIPIAISSVEPDMGKAARLGVKYVLPKPIKVDDLDQVLGKLKVAGARI